MASCAPCQVASSPPAEWVKCYGYTRRNIDDSDVIAYAQRGGAVKNQLLLAQACLLSGRLMYSKQCPGDCPQQTRINLGPISGITKGLGLAGTGIAAGSAIGLAATGGAGIGASAGGAGVALGGLPAIFGTISIVGAAVAIPLAIWGAISAHHKIAVAREQATICDVTMAYNSYADTVEYAIANGTMAVNDAKQALPTIEQQLLSALQAIAGAPGSPGGCNAACFYQRALRALDLYSLEKQYDALNPKNMTNPANPAWALASVKKSKLSEYTLAGIGSFGVVKLAGAFI